MDELREWKSKRYPRDDYSGEAPIWDQTGGRVTHAGRGRRAAEGQKLTRPDGVTVVFKQGELLPEWA